MTINEGSEMIRVRGQENDFLIPDLFSLIDPG